MHPNVVSLLQQAAMLHQRGQTAQAVQAVQQVLRTDPHNHPALQFLASVALAAGNTSVALDYAERAVASDPASIGSIGLLANCYALAGRDADAIDCYERAVALQPQNDSAHYNLGTLRERAGDTAAAREAYGAAVRINPANLDALGNLIMLEVAAGDDATALAGCRDYLDRRRGGTAPLPDTEAVTTIFKLRHDSEQIAHLRSLGLLDEDWDRVAAAYLQVIDDMAADADTHEAFRRHHPRHHWKDHWQLMNRHYNRPAYVPTPDCIGAPLINPELPFSDIEADYAASEPQAIAVDDLLTGEALAALRHFCQAATIWYDVRRNYLGAYFMEGFANPLTLGIARALRESLPGIFADHALTQAWAYKYGPEHSGIGIHADAAAVNCNFWIAPDEANLDPEHGGLRIFRKEAPLDWDFDKFNNDNEAINAFLADAADDVVTIPHRENRIVIFNSNLFHQTDEIHFRDDYLSRRINVTMLYGRRGR
jgi:tetratricopeptide (TPR) repeat protein